MLENKGLHSKVKAINFNCNSKFLVYLLSCKTCGKQYNGKTVDKFRSKWNNYKTYGKKASIGNIKSCKQQFVKNHFLLG